MREQKGRFVESVFPKGLAPINRNQSTLSTARERRPETRQERFPADAVWCLAFVDSRGGREVGDCKGATGEAKVKARS